MSASKVTWHKIAWPQEIASMPELTPKQLILSGKKYCLVRKEGRFYVLDDRCPHAGGLLSNGWCDENGNVVCPYHRLRYRLDTGQLARGKGYYVNSYETDLRPDGLYMAIPRRSWFSW
jgi:3-phenylpropionate/trans-cinnamate dioxygenase ferredoxin subunit